MTFLDRFAGGMLRGQGWLRRPTMLSGCLTAAAVIAAADSQVSLARRSTVDQILDELHAQEDFDLARALMDFDETLGRLRSGGSMAREAALAKLRQLAEDEAVADVVLRVARAVALADGPATAEVSRALAEIADHLGRPQRQLETAPEALASLPRQVIVVGNEKGGSGKSTLAIHIALGIAQKGTRVACIDMDGRQATLSRFMANRMAAAEQRQRPLVVPRYRRVEAVEAEDKGPGSRQSGEAPDSFLSILHEFADHEVVVVDTPGRFSRLASQAYSAATTMVTPINDSFVDVDALAEIDFERREVRAPSPFARLVLEEKDLRGLGGGRPIDWVVARNRIGHLDNRNAREMAALLATLSRRLGFRLQPGLSDRLVYRGLFYHGLTLFDLNEAELPAGNRPSLRRARQEVGELLDAVTTEEP